MQILSRMRDPSQKKNTEYSSLPQSILAVVVNDGIMQMAYWNKKINSLEHENIVTLKRNYELQVNCFICELIGLFIL